AEAIIHWTAGEEPIRWNWAALIRQAERFAGWLHGVGVQPGQVCALIIRRHPQFYPLYLGTSLSGALPAVLAYPTSRLHPDKFRQGLEGMAHHSGLDWVLTEGDLEPVIRDLALKEPTTVRGILLPLESEAAGGQDSHPAPPLTVADTDPCLLQHSS